MRVYVTEAWLPEVMATTGNSGGDSYGGQAESGNGSYINTCRNFI